MGTEASLVTRYKTYSDYTNPNPVGKAITNGRFRYWEIAVAVPVPNNHFSYYAKIRKLLYASTTAVATSIQIECSSNAEAVKVRECLDLTIGNINTGGFAKLANADDSASTIIELSRVTAPTVSGTVVTVYLDVAIGAIYDTTAIFTFYTPKLAESWDIENNYIDTNTPLVSPHSLRKILPSDLDNAVGGVVAQMLKIESDLAGDAFSNVLFRATLRDDIHRYINTSYVYRMGMRYTLDWGNIANTNLQLAIYFYNNLLSSGQTTVKNVLYNYNNSDYVKNKYFLVNSGPINGTSFASLSSIRSTASKRKIGIVINPSAVAPVEYQDYYIGIQDFWFEHSGGVENYDATNSLGCLLLPVPPNRDSLSFAPRDEDAVDFVRGDNNNRFAFNTYGNPNQTKKAWVKCTFQNIPMAQYQKLKTLEGFQSDGYLLNLHPHILELPEVLTGYMRITNERKASFDFSQMTFDLEFQEA